MSNYVSVTHSHTQHLVMTPFHHDISAYQEHGMTTRLDVLLTSILDWT